MADIAGRFWPKVAKTPECWDWTAGTDRQGYGFFGVAGRSVLAHRYAWALVNGPIPSGMHVLHRCDRPRCVRPDHLFLGTNRDNIADRMAKGRDSSPSGIWNKSLTEPHRLARGERVGGAKLTAEQVIEIRTRHDRGESIRSLAIAYGVGRGTAQDIIHGRSWAHV
jgi:hypothetical protein